MPRARRCPVCRGSLGGPFGEQPAPNRVYCSATCRQEAYRRRNAGTGPAAARRAEAARQAELERAAAPVERLITQLHHDLDALQDAAELRAPYGRLSYDVREIAGRLQQLAVAAVTYDRALGVTWAELAEDAGVDETTLRRRSRRVSQTGDLD